MIDGHKKPFLPLPDGAEWVDLLTTFSPKAGETLVSVILTLYPFDGLPVPVYRQAVLGFDRMAAYSAVTRELIDQTIALLDASSALPFRERTESSRVAELKAIETTAGLILLQRMSVRYLHDGLEAWQAFAREEASTHQGGDAELGDDDLDLLPLLPEIPGDEEAS